MTPSELLDQVYDELRALAASKMAREPAGHTLDATGLVNEAWLRLKAQTFTTKGDFLRAAAVAMRRILVDHARAKRAGKRGGGRRVEFDAGLVPDAQRGADLEYLDEALDRLAAVQPLVAELVQLRYFSGLTVNEAAAALGVAPRTADAWWAYARAWLADDLSNS